MKCQVAYPNSARLTSHALVTDIDIVIACGQVNTGRRSQGNVATAGDVAKERVIAIGRVVGAGGVIR